MIKREKLKTSIRRPFIQLLAAIGWVFFAEIGYANPQGGNVVAGQAAITSPTANHLQVNQSSNKAIIEWRNFNIGANESTHFQQPAGGMTLNRISPLDGASQIYGRLTATGQIILVNPAGIHFGPSAYVNVGGLIATTADISNQNFLNGNYQFTNAGPGAITNQGTIIAKNNGLVALVGKNVTNSGHIEANLGSVVLASGSAFTVSFAGNEMINFTVDGKAVGGKITNTGKLKANGGRILVTAKAASQVLDETINMKGVAVAKSVSVRNGEIILSGDGTVNVSGKLIATGKRAGQKGGKVKVLGDQVVLTDKAKIDVSGNKGGGEVLIGGNAYGKGAEKTASYTFFGPDVIVLADATQYGNGGKVVVWSDIGTGFYGNIYARGGQVSGNGGWVETSGKDWLDSDGLVSAHAYNGSAGSWLLDPRNVTISTNSTFRVSSSGTNPITYLSTGNDARVNNTTINTALNAGTSVTITTGGSGGQVGDITVSAPITKTSGPTVPTLTLNAINSIFINSAIGYTSGGLNVTLNAGNAITQTASITAVNLTTSSSAATTLNHASNQILLYSGVITGVGNLSLNNTVGLNINSINLNSGTFNLTNNGLITQSGAIVVPGTTTIASNFNNITLDHIGNNFSTIGFTNGNNITVRDSSAINFNTSTAIGSFTVTAGGTISQSGILNVTGTPTFSVPSGSDILLGGFANTFNSTPVIPTSWTTRDLNIRNIAATAQVPAIPGGIRNLTLTFNNAGMVIPALAITGDLNLVANGAITQSGAITLYNGSQNISVQAGAANNITFTNPSNFFSRITVPSGNNVSIIDNNPLIIGTANISGDFSVNVTNGGITQNGIITANGNSNFSASSYANIVLNLNNNFNSIGIGSGNDITINDINALNFLTSSISGALTVTNNGDITQSGAIVANNPGKTSTFTPGSGNNINLTHLGNDFSTIVFGNGNNVSVTDANALVLGATTLGGDLTVQTDGPITQNGALIVANIGKITSLSSGASNNVTLTNAGNNFANLAVLSANDVSIVDTNSLILNASNVSGNFNIVTNGALTQTGALTINGLAGFTAGSGNNITLNDSGNDFSSVSIFGGNNILLADSNGIDLAASTISGTLGVTSGGFISQSGILNIAGTPTFTLTNPNSDILLSSYANTFAQNPIFTNNGNIRDIAIRNFSVTAALSTLPASLRNLTIEFNNNGVTLPALNLSGNLNVTVEGTITQSGALIVNGNSAFSVPSGSDILLASYANNFVTPPTLPGNYIVRDLAYRNIANNAQLPVIPLGLRDLTITFDNAAIEMPALSVTGNVALTANGNITQTGAFSLWGVGQSLTLASGTNDIILNQPSNVFYNLSILSGDDVDIAVNNPLTLGASTISGAFIINNTNGGINQSGAITVGGSTDLSVNPWASILLDNASNNFNIFSVGSASAVTVRDLNAIILGASTVGSNYAVTAGSHITQNGALNISGTSTFTATSTSTDILLADAANTFNNIIINNGTNVRDLAIRNIAITAAIPSLPSALRNLTLYFDNAALNLPGVNLSGNLTATAGGAITQAGPLIGNLLIAKTLNNTGSNITLSNANNNFANVNLSTRNVGDTANASGAISYRDINTFNVTGINTLSTINLISGGTLTDSGAITGTQLTTSSTNGTILDFGHAINGFNATNTSSGNLILNNTGTLAISGITQTGLGSLSITNTGHVNVDGAISSPGGVLINSAGSLLTLNSTISANVLLGDSIVLNAGQFINNAGSAALSPGLGRYLVWSGDPANDNRGGLPFAFIQYNATYNSSLVLGIGNGFLYSLPASLNPILTGAVSKGYDGTAFSNLIGAILSVTGAQAGDNVSLGLPVSGSYDNKNAGVGKTVNALGITLISVTNDGKPVYGYTLSTSIASGAIGTITAAPITVTAQTDSRTYNGTTSSAIAPVLTGTIFGGDSVDTAAIQTYDNKNVGTGKLLTASGLVINDGNSGLNYAINYLTNNTGVITAAPITVTAQTDTRTYNGTTSSAIAPVLTGTIFGGDSVDTAAIQSYDNKNVGTNKILTASGLVMNDGNSGLNYAINYLTNNTGVITAAPITITAQTDSRTYNGTTSSTVVPVVGALFGTDTVTTAATQVFDNKNVGTGKLLTASGLVINDGNSGLNYAINYLTNNTGVITAAPITVTAQTDTRTYNGTTSSAILPVLTGTIFGGDTVDTSATQVFDNKNVGTGKTLTASGLVINDGNSGLNYAINYLSNNTGVITAAPITVTAQTDTRTYNGTTSSAIAPVLSGTVFGGDTIDTAATQVFDNKNVGTGKILTASGLVIDDGNSGLNYAINYLTNNTGVITAAPITVTAQTDTRTYNGTTSSTVVPVVGALFGTDTVTTDATQVFDNKNVGTGKILSASGLVINDGNSGLNYAINYLTNNTGIITAAPITVTAQTDTRTYNGTISSSVAPVLTGTVFAGDSVDTAAIQTYDNKNVGTGKLLTASGLVIDDGNSGLNYAINYLTNNTGVITAAPITVTAQTDTRTYNGTTSSTVVPVVGALFGTDTVTTDATQVFDNKNVGTGKLLTASGLVIDDGNSGLNYAINYLTNNTGVITAAPITVTAQTDTRTYNGTTSSAIAPVLTGTIFGGDSVDTAAIQTYDNKNVGTGKLLTASGLVINDGNSGLNYAINYLTNNTGVITAAPITVTAQTDTRTYNGTTSSAIAPVLSGTVFGGDTIDTAATQVFDNKNVGTGKLLTASGLVIDDGNSGLNYAINYLTNNTGVITAAPITVTAQTDSRTYNGTTSSTVVPVVGALFGTDTVTTAATQVFNNKNVGTNKILTASGLVINDGNSGLNYAINYLTNNTGVITAAPITVTAQTDTRTYNGTTSSAIAPVLTGTIFGGDSVDTAAIQSYDNKNVGTNKILTASGLVINDGNSGLNYAINYLTNNTGVITAAPITVTAQTDTRTYNGTTSSAILPVLTGTIFGGDTVDTSATQVFDNKNVGTGKTLTASGLVINDGNSGLNYAINYLTNNTGVITAAPITVTAQTDTRTYNGTTSSSVAPVLTGTVFAGDSVDTAAIQTYNNKNVGTGKILTASGLVIDDGNSGLNYAINYLTNNTGVITAAPITVTAQTDTRTYNGTTSSAIAPVLSGTIFGGDTVDTAAIQTYDNKNVGTGKLLTASGLVINDGNSGLNYAINYLTNNTAVITAAPITVTAQADSRTYNGTTSSAIAPVLSGTVFGGDTIDTAATQVFDNKNVGTGKLLTASGLVINDGNSGLNYAINYLSNNTGVITAAPITVTAQTDTRTYNGTTSSAIAPVLSGTIFGGDTVDTSATQVFDNKNVGTNKILTASGLVINDGNSGLNYAINYLTNNTGVITAAPITVTAQTDTRTYNGTTSSAIAPVLSGTIFGGDTVDTSATQVFDNKNVGTNKLLTASGLVINDGNSGLNYAINYLTNNSGVITAAPITVTAQIDTRTYNGTVNSAVAPVLTGTIFSGDSVDTAAIQSYDNKNVGTNKILTASGLVINDGNSGLNYAINYLTNNTGVITAAPITVTAQTDTRTYNGTISSSVAPVLTGTVFAGDSVDTAAIQTYDNKNVGTGKLLTASGLVIDDGNSGLNYAINYLTNNTGVITAAPITVTAQTDTRTYNGTISSSVAPVLTGTVFAGDSVDTAAIQTYDNKNVGTGKLLTASGLVINDGNSGLNYAINYLTNNTGVITAAPITVTAQTDSRIYNGTASSAIAPVLSGTIFGGDSVDTAAIQTYDNKNVGIGKILTASGLVIDDGNSGLNYAINYLSNNTGVITAAPITVTAQTDTRTYNGTTSSAIAPVLSGTVFGGDTIDTAATQVFDNKNVGTGKILTASGLVIDDGNSGLNYAINYLTNNTGVITAAPITVTAQTDTRTYNGTTSSTVVPVVGALFGTDTVTTDATQVFDNKNVGTGKILSASGLVIDDGNSGLNYAINYLTNNTGVITAAPITVTAQTDTRTYNGTISSSVAPVLTGTVFAGDSVDTAAIQTYNNKNVGTGKILTASGLVIDDGNSGLNYAINYLTNNTGVITAAPITVTAQTDTRTYNGTTSSAIAPVLSGTIFGGDTVDTSATQVFDNKNVGTNKILTASGLVIDDGNSGLNYAINYLINNTGVITAAPITVTAQTDTRSYDGTTSSTVVPVVGALFGTDTVTTAATQVFDNKNVGTSKQLTASGLVINDGNSGLNYAINYLTNNTGVIIAAPITVTAQTDTRTYNGTTSSAIAPVLTGTIFGGDSVDTAAIQTYDNKNVGTNKILTASGLVINDGNSGLNYAINYLTNNTGVITAAPITVTAQTDTRTYNGTTSSAIAPVLTGTIFGGDSVDTAAIQTYDNKNVGTNKILTASGLVINDGNSGLNYAINYLTNNTGVITAAPITVTAQSDTRTYNGTISSSFAPVLTGTVFAGDSVDTAAIQTYDNKNVGTGKLLTASGLVIDDGNGGLNYAINYLTNNTGVITAAPITVTAQTDTRTYNGTISSSVAPVVGALFGTDTVTTAATQVFDNKNVGTGKLLTASGLVIDDGNSGLNYAINYLTNNTGVITAAPITVTAQTDTRTYNGTISSSVAPVLTGTVFAGDSVDTAAIQTYDNKNVGTNKILTASGLVINDGNSGLNYAINYLSNNTGVITAAPITVTAQTDTRTYNGTTSSAIAPVLSGTIFGGDSVDTAAIQTYNNKNVGTGKLLTASGLVINDGNSGLNYAINYLSNNTGVITAAPITVTAQTDTRTYNGTTSSAIAPVLSGTIFGGDSVDTAAIQTYNNKNVGTNKILTASGLVINDGNSGLNYAINYLTNNTGVITAASLTSSGIKANNKVYDGLATATLNFSASKLNGVFGSDQVSINTNDYQAWFASTQVGNHIPVSTALQLSGDAAQNYSFIQPSNLAANINSNNPTPPPTPPIPFVNPVNVLNEIRILAPANIVEPTPYQHTIEVMPAILERNPIIVNNVIGKIDYIENWDRMDIGGNYIGNDNTIDSEANRPSNYTEFNTQININSMIDEMHFEKYVTASATENASSML